ncbi:MAG TPA: hypothetical protein VIS57_03675, partial [Xanthomonadales bacterium]
MKIPDIKLDGKVDWRKLSTSLMSRIERLNPIPLIGIGALLLVLAVLLFFTGGTSHEGNEASLKRAEQVIGQVNDYVQNFRRVLEDQQVQELAAIAAADPDKLSNLKQYVSGRIPDLVAIELYSTDLGSMRGADFGPFGYAVLDMLLVASESGMAPAQIHGKGAESYLAMAVRVGEQESPKAYLLIKVKPDALISAFKSSLPDTGAFALDQYNGRFKPMFLSELSKAPAPSERLVWLRVPSALFRVGVLQGTHASSSMGMLRPVLFIMGLLFLGLGLLIKLRPPASESPLELQEDAVEAKSRPQRPASKTKLETVGPHKDEPAPEKPPRSGSLPKIGSDPGDGFGVIELPDLGFNLDKINTPRKKLMPPVELVESIFRAYDIRGIVDQTLDADVAYQVGQVVGTLTLEADAAPVVVARDGRASGVDLIQGLINGIASTGCDVVDIGAVPTGVLYFAAYDVGSATGVMVTGSHNPPEYNGIKMVIGGVTLAGDKITDIYKRIKNGNVRVGKGKVSEQDMLDRYRERIAGDIQLKRPLKVIADCGNGIAGVVAANVLRDIGAEVITL